MYNAALRGSYPASLDKKLWTHIPFPFRLLYTYLTWMSCCCLGLDHTTHLLPFLSIKINHDHTFRHVLQQCMDWSMWFRYSDCFLFIIFYDLVDTKHAEVCLQNNRQIWLLLTKCIFSTVSMACLYTKWRIVLCMIKPCLSWVNISG